MTIDPVVLLMEEFRSTEKALRKATALYESNHCKEHGEAVTILLSSMKSLYRDLFETVPTSALGARELIRMTAQRLPFSFSRYAAHFQEIADRLGMGVKTHADLVWLRAMRPALAGGLCGEEGATVAPLLGLAILGAARPVVVFRAIAPLSSNPEGASILARRQN